MTSPVQGGFVGWSPTDRVPGYYAEELFAQGAITAGSLTKKCLVTGLMNVAAGTATPNQDINQIWTQATSDALHGPGSEINLMCQSALAVQGIQLWAAPVAKATGSPTQGTVVLTFAGTFTTAGTVRFWIDGVLYSFGVSSTNTATQNAAACVAALQSNPRAPVTAANVAGVVTFTTIDYGVRTGDHSIYVDLSSAPSGLTAVLSSTGGAMTSANGITGARFTAGTGTETVTALLTALFPGVWDYIAVANNDTTALGAWKTQVETKAGITEGRLEQFTFGQNTTLSAATSLAQTTLNEFRASCVWINDGETPASQIAANVAALRSVTEGANPVAIYDGVPLVSVAPNRFIPDVPLHSQLVSAINNSVTPIITVNGVATIGMLITTYSLNGSNPDYRCLQTYYVSMADYARLDIGLQWLSSIKPNNPRVSDVIPANLPSAASGVSTPDQVQSWLLGVALGYQKLGWFSNVTGPNIPVAGFNSVANRIEAIFPCPTTPGNHQLGVSVRQLSSPYALSA